MQGHGGAGAFLGVDYKTVFAAVVILNDLLGIVQADVVVRAAFALHRHGRDDPAAETLKSAAVVDHLHADPRFPG